jgi:hypothetical protein
MRTVMALFLVLCGIPVCTLAAEATDCEHSGVKSVTSPDGRWVATVQEVVCAFGNKAGAAVVVDLALSADPTHSKRIFNMNVPRSRDRWPRVIWKSPSTLELWAPNRAEIGVRLEEFDGVRIEFKYCGDNPEERAQVVEYQTAFKKWMQDTTAWVQRRKADPSLKEPRPERPTEPRYSSDSCANVGTEAASPSASAEK